MPRPRVFYGWWVTLAFAALVFVSTGVRFTVGPFLKPMVADLGLDRASYSLVIAVGLLLYGAFIPVVGWMADRLGARPVTLVGIGVLALSTGATGMVTALWQLYLVWGLFMAFGLAATGHVVASAVVTRWFTRRRATALSVLGGASMAGMSLLVPVAMWLILTLGWRLTYGVIAAALLVLLLPLALGIIRESPEAMGLAPDGAAPAPPPGARRERTPVAAAVQTVPFWQLAGALSSCGFTMSLLSAHGVPMLTDHGYSPMLASWAMALLGGTSVGFAIGLGALLVLAAAGGATMGGVFAMTSALTATLFGRHSVGSVFGTMFLAHQTGAAAGSWLGGYLFEVTGGYGGAFAVGAAVLALAAVVSLTIDERAPRLRPAELTE